MNMLSVRLAIVITVVSSSVVHAHNCTTSRSLLRQYVPRPFIIDKYTPRSNKWGTVILIHGSAGLYSRQSGQSSLDNMGEHVLSCAGLQVLVPHYFDISGIRSTEDPGFIHREFPIWSRALRGLIKEQHGKQPLFLVGESLGGFLVLDLLTSGVGVSAASLISSGVPPDFLGRDLTRLPPLLLQHGDSDDIVPSAYSEQLYQLSRGQGGNVRLILYKDRHHDLSESMKSTVIKEELDFFMHNRITAHSR